MVETSKRRPFPRCYRRTLLFASESGRPTELQRITWGIIQARERYQSGELFLHDQVCQYRHLPKLLDVAEGLNYPRASHTIYGDLKGAGNSLGRTRFAGLRLGRDLSSKPDARPSGPEHQRRIRDGVIMLDHVNLPGTGWPQRSILGKNSWSGSGYAA